MFDPDLELGRAGAKALPSLLVTTRAAPDGPLPVLRLRSVVHRRDLPQVKHIGLFGSLWHRRSAQRSGFDDIVFTDDEGNVSEAEVLVGVTMVLLDRAHEGGAVKAPVKVSQLGGVDAAFATSSVIGVRPICSIDGASFAEDHPSSNDSAKEYEAIAPDPI